MAQVTLSIAGSDSSSGAGIQADLKTFSTLGVHGLTAVTSVVAESPHQVKNIFPLPEQSVVEQIECVAKCYPIGAIKTGMLYSAETTIAICEVLQQSPLSLAHLVVDPVLVASTGDELSKKDIISAYKEHLLPLATVVTPNIPEAEILLETKLTSAEDFKSAAKELASTFDVACLLKGGHSEGSNCIDYIAIRNEVKELSAKRLNIPMTHGTGCTLSAAITANLAKGQALQTALGNAKSWLHKALANSLHWRVEETETYCINQAEL